MDREALRRCILFWNLAINEYVERGYLPINTSLRDLALQYAGKRVTKEQMGEVSFCYNFDTIHKMIGEKK